MTEILLQQFSEKEFPEYKSWFNNPEMNKELGPMDDKWLKYVLSENDGMEYAAFNNDTLIAVLGIKFPKSEYPDYYITDFAVNPSYQRKGLGTKVLKELLKLYQLTDKQKWLAYINTRNQKALEFFMKNGWELESDIPDESDMLTINYKSV